MDQEINGFVMYRSFLDAAAVLDDAAFREFIVALGKYAFEGERARSNNPVVNAFLEMAIPNIKAAAARYVKAVENGPKGKEHG